MNPFLGRNFEAMDPLEWLARMSDHVPGPGQHRTLFYGEYANRTRGARHLRESEDAFKPEAKTPPRSSPSWARLIAKVYEVDPLTCTRCGAHMTILAFLTDTFTVHRILDHLGLSPPEGKPPPALRETTRVPVDEEGRELVQS